MSLNEDSFADRLLNSAFSPKGWIDSLALSALFDHKIEELNISKHQALKIMDLEAKTFDAFMEGVSPKIDYLTVLKLCKLLDISPSAFLDKFIIKVSKENSESLDKTAVRVFIAKNFDLEGLKKIGFIDKVNDFDKIEKKILDFFGYKSVFEYKRDIEVPAYSSSKVSSKKESLHFWVNMAYASFERMPNPNQYDRSGFVNLFPTLRAYSINMEDGLIQVSKLLFRLGITVIFIPKIYSDLHIRAATFCINGKPCIALTNYRNYYATLWFALIHECYHVLYDWDEIVNSESQSHLSAGMTTANIDEDAADTFAKKYLFGDDKMKMLEQDMDDPYYVTRIARSNNVHESIVYAFYAYSNSTKENKLFGKYHNYMPGPGKAISPYEPKKYESFTPIPQIVKNTVSLIK